jgi:catechol 2,3-dioxygenase-like lactoylglutathione lyase family enzyme
MQWRFPVRVQLALNVSDLDEAIGFYSRLFGTSPAKRRDGYANFEVADPPLKLVLFAGDAPGGTLNHLGVETERADEVRAARDRLGERGLAPTPVTDTECCFASKTETWVTDPDGARWEWYVRTGDTEQRVNRVIGSGNTCCA